MRPTTNWWYYYLAVAIVGFSILERYALKHPDRVNTLSITIRNLGQKWPLTIYVCGVFTGALSMHLWGCYLN